MENHFWFVILNEVPFEGYKHLGVLTETLKQVQGDTTNKPSLTRQVELTNNY